MPTQEDTSLYRIGVAEKRLDDHGKRLDEMQDLLTRLTVIEEQNQKRLDEQETRIKALESVPAEKLGTVTTAIITTLIGAVIGFIATKVLGA